MSLTLLTNPELERKALALAAQHTSAAVSVQKSGGRSLFTAVQNCQVWSAIESVLGSGRPIDSTLVRDTLDPRRGKKAHFLESLLRDYADIPVNDIDTYLPILSDYSERRRIAALSKDLELAAHNLNDSIRLVSVDFSSRLKDGGALLSESRAKSFSDELPAFADALEAKSKSDYGVKVPFRGLGRIIATLAPGDLTLLAARPSMGKTTMAVNWAAETAKKGKALFLSLEMSREQVFIKTLAAEIGRPQAAFTSPEAIAWVRGLRDKPGKLTDLLNNLFVVDDTVPTFAGAQAVIYDFCAAHNTPDVVVIDYIQLMGGGHPDSRESEVGAIARGLKNLAKELKIPVLALAQLNRNCEMRANKRPLKSDLRDSGELEQNADNIIFLHREDYYGNPEAVPGLTELIVAKQRMGPVGTAEVYFEAEKSRFVEGAV